MYDAGPKGISRRAFLKGATTAAAAAGTFGILRRGPAQDAQPLTAGLIGCGGRGTGAVQQFIDSSENVQVIALADLFEDRLNGARNALKENKATEIADDMCFTGFDAYEKLVATDVDVVLIATPPHFRPPQFAAAIEAGKHVFMEKPLAADPVGCRQVMDAATRADELGLSVVVGTQRHHQASYVECRQRILDGAIGDILSARAYWCGGPLGGWERTDRPTDLASQIRSWFHWAWLSGDHIVEQHVHNLDICNWFIGKHPVRAYGLGYRARKTYGDSYDFFAVDYEYEGRVQMSSLCRQVADCDNNVSEWLVGTDGIANCWGEIWDHAGNRLWRYDGEAPSPYVQEHTDLVNAIRSGERINEAHGVAESTMTAIMGRMSAYTGKAVTWDQVMESDLSMGPDEYDLEADFDGGPVPVPGVPQ